MQNKPVDTQGHVHELGHIVLYVKNLDRSQAFYCDLLLWPLAGRSERFRFAGFTGGNTHHELLLIEVGASAVPVPTGQRLGMYHFGVKVGDSDDDLRAVLSRINKRPDLASVVGAVDGGVVHSLYVLDPDGNEVELYIDVPGFDWKDPALWQAPTRLPLIL